MRNFNDRLMAAIKNVDGDSVRDLIQSYREYGPMEGVNWNEALCAAIKGANPDIVRLLLRQRGTDIRFVDKGGKRPLHYAVQTGSPKILKQVLNAGSSVNVYDDEGYTALHYACRSGKPELVALLLQEGASVNRSRTYFHGETPLHFACHSGHFEIVKLLLARVTDPNVITSVGGYTALHKAVEKQHTDVVRLLCEYNVDVNKKDAQQKTAMHVAAINGFADIVQILLDYSADPSIKDVKGRTVLHSVCSASHFVRHQNPQPYRDILQFLLETSVNVNEKDEDGCTALHLLAVAQDLEMTAVLVSAGADIDAVDDTRGETPLNTATAYGHYDVARALLALGADVNIPDRMGSLPLHKLQNTRRAAQDPAVMARTLIQNGSKLNVVNMRGHTPLDSCVTQYAVSNFMHEVLEQLVLAGANLHPVARPGRAMHNSALCWLTWHEDIASANFLVTSGWDLRQEPWIAIPGKTAIIEEFVERLRQLFLEPISLLKLCRISIRKQLLLATDDQDIQPSVEILPLPTILKNFLKFKEERKILRGEPVE